MSSSSETLRLVMSPDDACHIEKYGKEVGNLGRTHAFFFPDSGLSERTNGEILQLFKGTIEDHARRSKYSDMAGLYGFHAEHGRSEKGELLLEEHFACSRQR